MVTSAAIGQDVMSVAVEGDGRNDFYFLYRNYFDFKTKIIN